nr:hypothetical protein [Legionella gresilensis]
MFTLIAIGTLLAWGHSIIALLAPRAIPTYFSFKQWFDGVNDAITLPQADIGIAMGTGSDIAIESADMTLLYSDLVAILKAYDLSKTTIYNIRQNLFFAFIYNIIGVSIAAGLLYPFTGLLLSPIFAAAAMSLSSVSVILNTLRSRFKAEKL